VLGECLLFLILEPGNQRVWVARRLSLLVIVGAPQGEGPTSSGLQSPFGSESFLLVLFWQSFVLYSPCLVPPPLYAAAGENSNALKLSRSRLHATGLC
jgi:hypothetical protein